MALIHLESLTKTYAPNTQAQVEALRGICLDISEGEFCAIVGTSGSGKSTLLHILGCLDVPTSGRYYLDSQEVSTLNERKRARIRNQYIGIVLQEFGLLPQRTVIENVALPLYFDQSAHLSYSQRKQRVQEVLTQVGLESKLNTLVSQLSGGQKQRVAIARAIINHPKLLLADEPTGALDQKTAGEIMELFSALSHTGVTILLVTHDKNIAQQCRRVLHIEDGLLADAGQPWASILFSQAVATTLLRHGQLHRNGVHPVLAGGPDASPVASSSICSSRVRTAMMPWQLLRMCQHQL